MNESNLDRTERRVIGTLMEKAFTVPDAYPLTLNSLVAGCAQKSNRDPVFEIPEHHVEGALKALFVRGWIDRRSREGGRVTRWGHRVRDKLSLDDREQAVLAELLLRGPQTVGNLRGRASRMRPFASTDEVLEVLTTLAENHLVERMAKRPGERGERWRHLMAPEAELAAEVTAEPEADRPASPPPPPAPPPPYVEATPAEPVPVSPAPDRIVTLEREVRALRDDLDELRREVRSLREDSAGP